MEARQFIVTNIFIIVGWVVTHILSLRLQNQQAYHQQANTIVKEVESLETLAITYHTNTSRNVDNELQIILLLDRIEAKANVLSKKIDKKLFPIWQLRSSITMNNFSTNNFMQQTSQSNIVIDIHYFTQRLIIELYSV